MALTLETDTQAAITLEEYVDYVSREVDADDEASIIASAHMLRALANNRRIVGDYLTAELRVLEGLSADQQLYRANPHARTARGRFAVRANIWEPPARRQSCARTKKRCTITRFRTTTTFRS